MNEMISKAMLRQSIALLNSMDIIVARIITEIMGGEYQETVPQMGTCFGETKFYSRPLYIPLIKSTDNIKAEFVMNETSNLGEQPVCYEDMFYSYLHQCWYVFLKRARSIFASTVPELVEMDY